MAKNNRPTGVFKTANEYQKVLDPDFYEKCPKAVFAAIAVSYAINHSVATFENVTGELLNEWRTLNENEIVPQKAPKL